MKLESGGNRKWTGGGERKEDERERARKKGRKRGES